MKDLCVCVCVCAGSVTIRSNLRIQKIHFPSVSSMCWTSHICVLRTTLRINKWVQIGAGWHSSGDLLLDLSRKMLLVHTQSCSVLRAKYWVTLQQIRLQQVFFTAHHSYKVLMYRTVEKDGQIHAEDREKEGNKEPKGNGRIENTQIVLCFTSMLIKKLSCTVYLYSFLNNKK